LAAARRRNLLWSILYTSLLSGRGQRSQVYGVNLAPSPQSLARGPPKLEVFAPGFDAAHRRRSILPRLHGRLATGTALVSDDVRAWADEILDRGAPPESGGVAREAIVQPIILLLAKADAGIVACCSSNAVLKRQPPSQTLNSLPRSILAAVGPASRHRGGGMFTRIVFRSTRAWKT